MGRVGDYIRSSLKHWVMGSKENLELLERVKISLEDNNIPFNLENVAMQLGGSGLSLPKLKKLSDENRCYSIEQTIAGALNVVLANEMTAKKINSYDVVSLLRTGLASHIAYQDPVKSFVNKHTNGFLDTNTFMRRRVQLIEQLVNSTEVGDVDKPELYSIQPLPFFAMLQHAYTQFRQGSFEKSFRAAVRIADNDTLHVNPQELIQTTRFYNTHVNTEQVRTTSKKELSPLRVVR